MTLMLGAHRMAVKDAPLGFRYQPEKKIQTAERQMRTRPVAKISRADWDLYASARKGDYPLTEAATAVLHTDPWIRISSWRCLTTGMPRR